MANFQKPRVPELANGLDRSITQLHSSEYKNPGQLQDGPVLVASSRYAG